MGVKVSPGLRRLLDQKKIRRSKPANTKMIAKELDLALQDLEVARQNRRTGDYRQTTIQAHGSIHHAAHALLHRTGYQENNPRALLPALQHLYETRIINNMLSDLRNALQLREKAENKQIISERTAQSILDDAEDFVEEAARILAAPRQWFEKRRC